MDEALLVQVLEHSRSPSNLETEVEEFHIQFLINVPGLCPACLVDILHDVFSGGFEVRDEGNAITDPLEVIQGDLDSGGPAGGDG